MSKTSFKKMSEIEDFIQKTGKEGVRLLLLFKLLKARVKERIKRTNPSAIIEEEALDKLCIQKAHEIIKLKRDSLTEKEFEENLSTLDVDGKS